MAESELHRSMKERVSRQLEEEGYSVFLEPLYPPSRFLTWTSYRPDVLGIRAGPSTQEYALVECETNPSTRKLDLKNFRSLEVQTRLDSELSVRRIVVVPRGTLRGLNSSVRRSWETWVYEGCGLRVFPRALTSANGFLPQSRGA